MKRIERKNKQFERGGAGVKLVAVLVALFLLAHAGYNYIPAAYDGENFKQEMQTAVVQGMATPNNITPVDMVKGKIQRAIAANNIPADAVVQVKSVNRSIAAQVVYSKKINILPFGLYTYVYQFDHTATPTGFLLKDSTSIQ